MSTRSNPRWPLASVRRFDIVYLQRQNPVMVAWWSAAFPGFGHLLLFKSTIGVLLTLSEVIINSLASINIAMVYSFCGNFDMAKEVLQPLWAYGYMIIYFFAIWDSYRCAIQSNKHYELALIENARFPIHLMRSTGVQFVEKKRPLAAAFCSFAFPGLGQIYNKHIWLGFYAIFWWWVYLTFSHAYEAVLAFIIGHNHEVRGILHPQWLMFMPSVIGGAVYHAYTSAIEQNRLFRILQRQYLADYYRKTASESLDFSGGYQPLWIVGTFEHSTELEQALAVLEHSGIDKSRITPVLMDTEADPAINFVDQKYDHSSNAIEIGFACATAASVIGISIGFILQWGPIIWGIILALSGFFAGYGIGLFIRPRHKRTGKPKTLPEVTVLVQYEKEEEAASIKQIFWKYKALTVGKLDHPSLLSIL
ncbi:hypothetical protein [Paenibacillus sedimenti]|uniref:Uncharacterized protein n=1 Tax=Paenibacillus sedimenti TaxID=2770274 RepID=A0A926QLI1_9BACL|nr:hypothetical protein [Paenibacillus sedimenti]MBD0382449.1 hypothetical protein [Paenibacillus sedimenti]